MTLDPIRCLRYAPEIALVEVAILILERLRGTIVAAHGDFDVDAPPASREQQLAAVLLRAIERFVRAARRYFEYVRSLALVDTAAVDVRQLEMF